MICGLPFPDHLATGIDLDEAVIGQCALGDFRALECLAAHEHGIAVGLALFVVMQSTLAIGVLPHQLALLIELHDAGHRSALTISASFRSGRRQLQRTRARQQVAIGERTRVTHDRVRLGRRPLGRNLTLGIDDIRKAIGRGKDHIAGLYAGLGNRQAGRKNGRSRRDHCHTHRQYGAH